MTTHTAHAPLVVLGSSAGQAVTFWRLPWRVLAADDRSNRLVVAPLLADERVLVATPEQFTEVVMQGPREHYMGSRSWRGETDWAKQDRRAGGSYLQKFRDGGTQRPLSKFRPLLRRRAEVMNTIGDLVDVVRHDGNRCWIETVATVRLFER